MSPCAGRCLKAAGILGQSVFRRLLGAGRVARRARFRFQLDDIRRCEHASHDLGKLGRGSGRVRHGPSQLGRRERGMVFGQLFKDDGRQDGAFSLGDVLLLALPLLAVQPPAMAVRTGS